MTLSSSKGELRTNQHLLPPQHYIVPPSFFFPTHQTNSEIANQPSALGASVLMDATSSSLPSDPVDLDLIWTHGLPTETLINDARHVSSFIRYLDSLATPRFVPLFFLPDFMINHVGSRPLTR